MPRLLFLLLLLSTTFSAARAQSNFQPGYVVPATGDTLRGEVDYQQASRLALGCRFRASATAPVTEYTPAQLRAFGITGVDHYQAQQLPGNPPTAVFMRALVLGSASLYDYTNTDSQTKYYFSKNAAPVQFLTQRDSTVRRPGAGGAQLVRERQELYKKVLWAAMADCPAAQVQVQKTELKESSLIKALTTYDACNGNTMQYARQQSSSKWQLELLGGFLRSTTTVSNGNHQEKITSFRPALGLGFRLSGIINPRLSLHGQLLLSQLNYDEQYATTVESGLFAGEPATGDVKVKFNTVRMPVMLRYTAPKGKVRPYIQAGALAAANFSQTASQTISATRGGGFNYRNTQPIDIRNYNLGSTIGVGAIFPLSAERYFNVEIRRESLDATSASQAKLGKGKALVLLLSYTLGQ